VTIIGSKSQRKETWEAIELQKLEGSEANELFSSFKVFRHFDPPRSSGILESKFPDKSKVSREGRRGKNPGGRVVISLRRRSRKVRATQSQKWESSSPLISLRDRLRRWRVKPTDETEIEFWIQLQERSRWVREESPESPGSMSTFSVGVNLEGR